MTRPRGYIADYRPQATTRLLLAAVEDVLNEYVEFWPITLRQLFYRLVGKHEYPKDERAYKRLGEHVNKARRAGWIPWEAIRDDNAVVSYPFGQFRDLDHCLAAIRHSAKRFMLDVSVGQDMQVVAWCEAAGMVPQIERVAHPYGVQVRSDGGFDSTSRRHEVAKELELDGRDAVFLHLGDYDPSGEAAFTAVHEDIAEYLSDDAPGLILDPIRVALTGEQVRDYQLITAPPKPTDSRTRNWQARKLAAGEPTETVQLEALAPDQIAALLTAAIESVLDMELVEARRQQTPAFQEALLMQLSNHSP